MDEKPITAEQDPDEPTKRRPQPYRRVWDPRYRTDYGPRLPGFLPYLALALAGVMLLSQEYVAAAFFAVPFLWWLIWWNCFGPKNRDD
jgi:hypothetical protein